MTLELTLIFAAIACIIGVSSFVGGKQSASKNDGERWGKLEATLQYMQSDLSEIKTTMSDNAKNTRDSLRRLHERIDNHLRNDHGMTVPKRDES